MTLKYSTTNKLGNVLGIVKDIPSWAIADDAPTNEAVSQENDSKTQVFLDQINIIASSFGYGRQMIVF